MKTIRSSSLSIEESNGTAVYLTNNLKSKHGYSGNKFNKYPCTAVCQRIIPPVSEKHLHLRVYAQDVRLATLHENLVINRQALVPQCIVEVASAQPFFAKTANWSSHQMIVPKQMKVATCEAAPSSWVDLRNVVSPKHDIIPEDSVNATQIYTAFNSKKQILERHHQVKHKNADKAE